MAMARLYRNILPSPPAIDFRSSEGKQLFLEAVQGGTMEGFFKLISFKTQSESAYCGLASLAMVLNALAIDPGRKGPWRWFDESMLDCCEPLEKIKSKGISFGKVVCLAHCAGAKIQAFCTNHTTLDDFRKYVTACYASDDCHVISSYHRGTFKQTGNDHFSPIGGYHAGRDMALILDVARYKYPPHWVPLTLLWDSMNTSDKSSGHHRGFMLISRLHTAPGLLCTLEEVLKQVHETGLYKYVTELLTSGSPCCQHMEPLSSKASLPTIENICCQGAGFLAGNCRSSCHETSEKDLQCSGIMPIKMISGKVVNGKDEQRVDVLVPLSHTKNCYRGSGPSSFKILHIPSNDVVTVLLLALPPETWSSIKNEELLQEIRSLVSTENLPTLLQEEVFHLRRQLLVLKRCKDKKVEEELGAPLL